LQFEEVFDGFAALAAIVVPAIITPTIATDPADDMVLATALAAREARGISDQAEVNRLSVVAAPVSPATCPANRAAPGAPSCGSAASTARWSMRPGRR